MPLRDRLARLIAAVAGTNTPPPELEPRHVLRELARDRHEVTGEPLWPAAERHEYPDGTREVRDVTPGTPGAFGSRRRIGRGRG